MLENLHSREGKSKVSKGEWQYALPGQCYLLPLLDAKEVARWLGPEGTSGEEPLYKEQAGVRWAGASPPVWVLNYSGFSHLADSHSIGLICAQILGSE